MPYNKKDLQYLSEKHSLFDLIMDFSPNDHYLVVFANTIFWLGIGSQPGKLAYQACIRSTDMNENNLDYKLLGNVGLFGKYASVNDAFKKVFSSYYNSAICVEKMKLTRYNGNALKAAKYHHSLITPIVSLLTETNSNNLNSFFHKLGWNNLPRFTHQGKWSVNKRLFIDGQEVDDVEDWVSEYLKNAL